MSAPPGLDAGDIDAMAAEAAVVDAMTAETATSETDAALGRCPNCGVARTGHFCASCGQKGAPLAPTLGYVVHELTHEVLNVDGKIFRTLRLLLTRPGFLTREIFAGRRASYVLPIRLYLIASILAFAVLTFLNSWAPMWGTLWRTVTVGVLYSVAYMLAVIAIVAPTVSPLFVDQSP